MKRYLYTIILLLVGGCAVFAQGSMQSPANIGTQSSPFYYGYMINTVGYSNTNNYNGNHTNDVYFKLTLSKPMGITAYCLNGDSYGAGGVDAYLYVLDASGNPIDYDWHEYVESGISLNVDHYGYFRKLLPIGTYYIAVEGYHENGIVDPRVIGTTVAFSVPYTEAGSYSSSFAYSGTVNTATTGNFYQGKSTNDVKYKFTLTRPMDVTISHCGSELSDTYLSLLDASGNLITSNDDYSGVGKCDNTLHSYLKRQLSAGTYYVVSEGYSGNGNITTTIQGEIPYIPAQPSQNQNYIKTRTYTSADGNNFLESVQYFDGLGRPNEQVQVGITPTGADLVHFQEYDGLGRNDKAWLPAVAASNNGTFVSLPDFKIKSTSTYNATTYNAAIDAEPYSYPIYENSPLNRVTQQYGPGAAWHNNGKAVKIEYLTNTTSGDLSCGLYKVNVSNGEPTLTRNSNSLNYTPKQLFVTKTTDEEGNVSYEFKDKLGQVVLQRQMNGTTKHDTYYVYDDFGNKCFVVPPIAADATSVTTAHLNNYIYQYKYDSRNRCIARKIPGADWVYSVYDKADRLILSQDGVQRINKNWTFYKYDTFGRVILSGVYTDTKSHSDLCTEINALLVTETITGGAYGYSWNVLPQITYDNTLLVNHYDDYQHLLSQDPAFQSKLNYETKTGYDARYENSSCSACSAKGLLVGTREKLLDGSGEIVTMMYYDDKGRMVQTKSINHLGGIEREYLKYNFSGQPLKKLHEHTPSATGAVVTEVYTYTYDSAGRLLQTAHELNGKNRMILANNAYDELGRLKTSMNAEKSILKTTYAYNIRSWIQKLSVPDFIEDLTYTYNGNIETMQWRQASKIRKYTFTYDGLSRLKTAVSNSGSDVFNTSYIYDKHGNITSLSRQGLTATKTYGFIDNLTMDYGNTNQLKNVTDAIVNLSWSNLQDFKDYTKGTVGAEYVYNKNGSMTMDINKGISKIAYNSLNLPQRIDIKSPIAEARNEYVYSASGQKLKVVQKWNPSYSTTPVIGSTVNAAALLLSKTTDYVGNKIYENGVLSKILTENGYYADGKYYFYIRDHLGNNRIVADQTATVVQSTQYYPFGMTFPDGTGQDKQAFKFGGKELDVMNGLNLYDFVARGYDPAIGRFMTIDPLAEKYYSTSPYAYCLNNPMRFIDPTGKDVWEIDELGNIANRIEDKTQDAFYKVDSDGQRITNEDGTEIGITFQYGTVKNRNHIINVQNADGNGTHEETMTIFEIKGDENASNAFNFMINSETNKVEWGNVKIGTEASGKNLLGTLHSENSSGIGSYALGYGYAIRQSDHNHPDGITTTPSERDVDNANAISGKFPSVTFNIYIQPHQSVSFNKSSPYIKPNSPGSHIGTLQTVGKY
ncbi:MAG: tRNA nuclease WapA [Candidatus Ordinivivax streblomastigis]|uniref:tRNA nuclease WapA n=1 Tax=Candidatus Ordinivivax streblomastigis TaxID=2540710 RepID=A0A5M8P258_9BACT|nr:MAG: tRNA nuclease WapA [Candidatus Ordinivivax streblomastigis]